MRPHEPADVESLFAPPNHGVPNNPALPAVIYRQALPPDAETEAVMSLYGENGWGGSWAWGVCAFHHFHEAAHEVLSVVRGSARLHLGGEDGPEKEVTAGDVLILPAGFGHKRLDAAGDFLVVGGYPNGQHEANGAPIVRAAKAAAEAAAPKIAATLKPAACPIFGPGGPLLEIWGAGPA